jgi:hypothetical protein
VGQHTIERLANDLLAIQTELVAVLRNVTPEQAAQQPDVSQDKASHHRRKRFMMKWMRRHTFL